MIPLKSILLNLLSVGAAYGILVLVFRHHWAEGLLGFTSNRAITSWLPLFLVVVLFGLSMDYHVFILSRVKELALLPAAMKLLGDWNWYLPRWLEWLPSPSPEGTAHDELPEAAPAFDG